MGRCKKGILWQEFMKTVDSCNYHCYQAFIRPLGIILEKYERELQWRNYVKQVLRKDKIKDNPKEFLQFVKCRFDEFEYSR